MLPDWIGKVAAVVTLLLVALLSMPSGNEEGGAQSNGQSLRYSQGLLVGRRHRHAGQRQSRESERKVTYIVAGASVSQAMRCAGTDYKFNTSSKLTYSGGKISGSWSETAYDASGSVSGSAVGNTAHAVISGDKFSGRMSINVSGSRHTINIVVQLDPKSGTYRPAASVALHR
jgi:hypothetical protein